MTPETNVQNGLQHNVTPGIVHLDRWEVIEIEDDVTGQVLFYVQGDVSGDPCEADGERISTSPVRGLDLDRRVVRTRYGRAYVLREAAPHVHAGEQLRDLDAHLQEPF